MSRRSAQIARRYLGPGTLPTMLNDARCKSLPAKAGLYRVADTGSLFLCIRPSGAKSWEFRWKRGGKVKTIVLGRYPDLGLRAARDMRDGVKTMLHQGLDPGTQKKLATAEEHRRLEQLKTERERQRVEKTKRAATFERVAREWIENNRSLWTEQHCAQVEQSLRDHVFPRIGALPIWTVAARDVLGVLDRMLAEGKLETAARIKQRLSAVFEFAALRYHVTADPASLVKREFSRRLELARKQSPVENFAAIAPTEAPALLRALRAYDGPSVALVRLIALTACRTGEARKATWSEFDLAKGEWKIPAERMKARKAHTIPLSRQAVELLRELQEERDEASPFVFPHPRNPERTASENAVLYVLAAIGYRGRMTGHGLRSLFSTVANESRLWRKEVIEVSLAHTEQDDVRAAYLRTDFLQERRQLMQWWADELDRLEG